VKNEGNSIICFIEPKTGEFIIREELYTRLKESDTKRISTSSWGMRHENLRARVG
jgi:sRNA-binding carbon storage regulator CsrA